jgi:Mrp family chromosome partitioning ATPase/uncharacterized protein involved in exopolysaccharide biosynthesis
MGHAQPLPRDQLNVLVKLARRMRRHAGRGLLAFAVGVGLTLAVLQLKPKHYLSETVLYYQEGFQWDLRNEGARRAGQRLRETVLARTRLQQIVEDLGLFPKLVAAGKMDDAIEEMRRRTSFKVSEGDTFTLAFVGDSPEDAQRVTSTLAQSLIADNARLRSEQIDLAKSFLDTQRKRNEERLVQKETELARFLARHPELGQAGLVNPALRLGTQAPAPEQARPAAQDRSGAYAELAAAEQQALANLTAARRDHAQQRERFTPKHPAVAAAAAAVTAAEAAYQRAADALKAADPGGREARAAPRSATMPRIRGEVLEEHARLTRELEEERARFQQLDARQFVASMAANSFAGGHSAQVSVIDPAYLPVRPTGTRMRLLALAGLAASILLGVATALVLALLDDRVFDRSDVERWGLGPVLTEVSALSAMRVGPGSRAGEPPLPRVATAPMLASPAGSPPRLALPPAQLPTPPGESAVGQVAPPQASPVALARVTRAFSRLWELSRLGLEGRDAPPTFSVPTAPADGYGGAEDPTDPRLLLLRAPDSPAAASFRVLRYRLTERGGLKTILVTSPDPGEGKTTCASNLALALCEAGRAKVLLVDGNFRRPALEGLFGRPQPPGPEADARPPALWTQIEPVSLWLDFAPVRPDFADALLDGLAIRVRLEQLAAEGYDHIVIDGPPVLGSADVNLMEDLVSGILITSWSRRSQAGKLRRAIEQVGAHRVLGVVLMGS